MDPILKSEEEKRLKAAVCRVFWYLEGDKKKIEMRLRREEIGKICCN